MQRSAAGSQPPMACLPLLGHTDSLSAAACCLCVLTLHAQSPVMSESTVIPAGRTENLSNCFCGRALLPALIDLYGHTCLMAIDSVFDRPVISSYGSAAAASCNNQTMWHSVLHPVTLPLLLLAG